MAINSYRLIAHSSREFRRVMLAAAADDHANGWASPTDNPADPHARQVVEINGRRIGYDATVGDHPHINYLTALDSTARPRRTTPMTELRELAGLKSSPMFAMYFE